MAGLIRRIISVAWKEKYFLFVVAANAAQFLGRLGFAITGLDGGVGNFLDSPAPAWTTATIHVMFFALGIAGVPATAGFALQQRWGTRGMVILSAVTIAFDVWGFTVQPTAALGFVVPVISLAYVGIRGRMSQRRDLKRDAPLAGT